MRGVPASSVRDIIGTDADAETQLWDAEGIQERSVFDMGRRTDAYAETQLCDAENKGAFV